jgi:hypothetical protein
MAALIHMFAPYAVRENQNVDLGARFVKEGRGYQALQATKPQTLSYALEDSPVALLAWIYESCMIGVVRIHGQTLRSLNGSVFTTSAVLELAKLIKYTMR